MSGLQIANLQISKVRTRWTHGAEQNTLAFEAGLAEMTNNK